MRRWVATLILLLSVCAAQPAFARDRGPVCREPSVVDEMTREIRDRDYYTHVQAQLVTEEPTADPRVVHCQVCVQSAPYETMRFGDRPIRQCVARSFEITILSAGFVVRELR